MVTSAPHSRANSRYGSSETPDIGARKSGLSSPSHSPLELEIMLDSPQGVHLLSSYGE